MITSKQRATLRAMANDIPAIFQIGKEGITENMVAQLSDALNARELIKISILQNSSVDANEAMQELCVALDAQPVQCIGRRLVIYRPAKEPVIRL